MRVEAQLFTIWDSTAEAASRVFTAGNVALAARSFEFEVNTPGTDLAKFAEYMTLFHIGSIDLETMKITPLATPVSLGLAATFVKQDVPYLEASHA